MPRASAELAMALPLPRRLASLTGAPELLPAFKGWRKEKNTNSKPKIDIIACDVYNKLFQS